MAITLANHQFGVDLPKRWRALHSIINPYTLHPGEKGDFKSIFCTSAIVFLQVTCRKRTMWEERCSVYGEKMLSFGISVMSPASNRVKGQADRHNAKFLKRNGKEEKEIQRVGDLSWWSSSAKDEWGKAKCLKIDLLTFSLKNGRGSFLHAVQNNLETNCILNKFSD